MASLFDTGAFERLRRGHHEAMALAIDHSPPVISLHVAAEYLYGLCWVAVAEDVLSAAQQSLDDYEVLRPTLDTAAIYARLRADARRAGRQMPDADFWIAAHAMEERMLLVTLDRHFTFFDELNVHLLA